MNLADALEEIATRQPNAVAISGPGPEDEWTYAELNRRVTETASELRGAGVTTGHTVALNVPSGRDYIVLTYGLWRAGASVVPIAVELPGLERAAVCESIGLNAVITTPRQAQAFTHLTNEGESEALGDRFLVLTFQSTPEHPKGFLECNPAFLRFSSGTTGSSKGVVLSHETVWERIHAANELLHIGPDDRIVWLLSMSYHFTVSIVAYLTFGATVVLCPNHFGKTIVDAALRCRGTIIYGSPTHYALMSHAESDAELKHLRLAISTATALKEETATAFEHRFGLPLVEAYGIIEIGLPCINFPSPKPGSVGRVLPSYEIKLRDAGLGEVRSAIEVRGKGIIDAYYDPFRRREEVLNDGWFETGDLGYVDEDGYLFITGRSKELINSAGLKFFPREVEAVLQTHPAVADVCVFAAPDRTRGEVAHAHVVLAEPGLADVSPSELMEHCSGHLASYKIPEEITFVTELARTASGKVLRRKTETTAGKGAHP